MRGTLHKLRFANFSSTGLRLVRFALWLYGLHLSRWSEKKAGFELLSMQFNLPSQHIEEQKVANEELVKLLSPNTEKGMEIIR
jgi:hypothetical protein